MGRVFDQQDGLGIYSVNLLHHMLAKDTLSRYVILLRSPKNVSLFEEFPNAETQVIPSRSKTWWDQALVPLVARRVRADIIFNPKFSLPLLARRPGVFILHGSDWYVNPGNYLWWDNIYIRVMMPIYCRKAARLLSISQIAVDDLVKYARLDVSKATVTYAAPAPHFKPIEDRASLREYTERYRLPERFILTVARVYHTGHDRLDEYPGGNNESLVRGYQRYRAAGGDLPLVVVGKDIEKYLRDHGFGNREFEGIHFTGFIPNKEMVKVYNLAEFFVLATLYESFCLPLVEAMATGCPAIVPSTGGCPELGGEAARYVDPCNVVAISDAMLEMANSPELRARMRAAGLERARRYSWDRTAECTLEVLDGISPPVRRSTMQFDLVWWLGIATLASAVIAFSASL
jgi:glycosyltransferase involved in cell wall biosynthesis